MDSFSAFELHISSELVVTVQAALFKYAEKHWCLPTAGGHNTAAIGKHLKAYMGNEWDRKV